MTHFGHFLSSDDHYPSELVCQARMVQEAGFRPVQGQILRRLPDEAA